MVNLSPPTPTGIDPNPGVYDSFRTAIALRLSEKLGIDPSNAYDAIEYGKKRGVDFTVALPRFNLPGGAAHLAAKVTEGVSYIVFLPDSL